MSDTQFLLGKIVEGNPSRDAVHIAVVPAKAQDRLSPGEHVGFLSDGCMGRAPQGSPTIGIVDPFLTGAVLQGDQFWLFLYPNTITSLNHHWTHPSFGADGLVRDPKAEAEKWLRDFCASSDCPKYEDVMAALEGTLAPADDGTYGPSWGRIDGEYFHFDGRDAHSQIPIEFWGHAETVLGRKLPWRAQTFTCSC